jgi:hypothetical protein
MEFLVKRGQGIHHLSFGVIEDHDEMLNAFRMAGYGIEMQGITAGRTTPFTYVGTQKDLGTIFEFVKGTPGAKSTLKPYGFYPPKE